MSAKNTLLSFVKTGWKPQSQQVIDWILNSVFKEDMIPAAQVVGLEDFINSLPSLETINNLLALLAPVTLTLSGSANYAIPPGKTLDMIRFESGQAQTVNVFDLATSENLLGEINVPSNFPGAVGCLIPAGDIERVIQFTGVTSQTIVKLFLK